MHASIPSSLPRPPSASSRALEAPLVAVRGAKRTRRILAVSCVTFAAWSLVGCPQSEDHGAWRAELFTERENEPRIEPTFDETIRTPDRLRGIAAPAPDGGVVRVACFTCHGILQVELSTRAPTPLQPDVLGPHVGLLFDHGTLDCAHCHDPADPSHLRTADARSLPTTEALELCSQCHGLQWTDFQHGAHGGMRGHWDLNAGPRERNHCVDCHDPHRPAFGQYRPMPPPRDRFVPTPPHRANHGGSDAHASDAEHDADEAHDDRPEETP